MKNSEVWTCQTKPIDSSRVCPVRGRGVFLILSRLPLCLCFHSLNWEFILNNLILMLVNHMATGSEIKVKWLHPHPHCTLIVFAISHGVAPLLISGSCQMIWLQCCRKGLFLYVCLHESILIWSFTLNSRQTPPQKKSIQ